MRDERLELHATNTHLYVGEGLQAKIAADDLAASPRGLRIVFRDGVVVLAELVQNTRGEIAVDTPAYRTAAGTDIPAKAWRVSAGSTPTGSVLVVSARI